MHYDAVGNSSQNFKHTPLFFTDKKDGEKGHFVIPVTLMLAPALLDKDVGVLDSAAASSMVKHL